MENEVPEAYYFNKRIIVPEEEEANRIHERGATGKPLSGGGLQLAPVEALYLLEREKIKIISKEEGETLSFDDFFSKFSDIDPELMFKYIVYQDLRSRGYVVKTGLKYGAHFRVYERGVTPGTDHSAYLVHAISENENLTPHDLSRAVRLAHSVRKKMIFAVIDNEGDVTYYSLTRETP
ncbi:hypothetical protein AKJ45_02510 [candidate division MSBL1 archaeon SCGC-AAA261F19]|uniref:Uncharacterized protein n=2 Tax=candidate division MSBL1 TaxID=215777 RepID=A0A133V9G4_9EURY|nr:hypothetical protein AKJ43_00910 [candidate division MSBL1 archaeon SCGC-AAA261D19]KXB03110.1 hypothetical protein AKJ45_02510 [candidate division MSBL1 archaeon SCGC-AAA261F19]